MRRPKFSQRQQHYSNHRRPWASMLVVILGTIGGLALLNMPTSATSRAQPIPTSQVNLPLVSNIESKVGTPTPASTPMLTPSATPTSSPSPTPTSTPTATPCGQLAGVLSASVELLSGCDYEVTGNVLVSQGVTLTIPGATTLRFDEAKYLMVDGRLLAQGTREQPILFTHNSQKAWGGIRLTQVSDPQSTIAHAVIEYASVPDSYALNIYGVAPQISNIVLRYNNKALFFRPDTFTGVTQPVYAEVDGAQIISNTGESQIACCVKMNGLSYVNNIRALYLCRGNEISNSVFADNQSPAMIYLPGCGFDTAIVRNSVIQRNLGAFWSTSDTPVLITNNEISFNGAATLDSAIYLEYGSAQINSNNIYSNTTTYAVRTGFARQSYNRDTDATGNWWGTTDSTTIANQIYDYSDDFVLAKVYFTPYANAPIAAVGPQR